MLFSFYYVALFFSAFSNALFKSFNKSSASSMPQLMRTKSSGKPRAALTSAGILACDMKHGKEIKLVTPPKETVILNSFVSSTIVLEKLTSPVVKERMLPAPVAWEKCTSWNGLDFNPG